MTSGKVVPSTAKPDPTAPDAWIDGAGNRITGPAPLALLGVGGRYVDRRGVTREIIKIDTSQTDAKGRPFTIVHAISVT